MRWGAANDGGFDASSSGSSGGYVSGAGLALVVAFLGWFACLARGRMPQGFRDLEAYSLRYAAQTYGYLFLLTDRYPDSDPSWPEPAPAPTPPAITLHPDGDDLRRSRLSVFFRLLLTFPHFVWLFLWSIAAFVAVVVNWFAVLLRGRSPDALHRFLAAYVRYDIHVFAYLFLVANPFPGFTGEAGRYPVEVAIAPPERQGRLNPCVNSPGQAGGQGSTPGMPSAGCMWPSRARQPGYLTNRLRNTPPGS
jgi:hypothetical protein